ncbi:hypothetical protein ACRZ5S_19780 [Vibrio scophthalmi]|uniref:hypothetical protein n=1 Tax=Vibrio TaxID=662 RepID=UPI000BE30B37|nr:hypothetical protein [Vibrio parahaemolyticus]ATI44238.1 hypothetical protein CO725_00870 [Vibrio parahaemolyticus]
MKKFDLELFKEKLISALDDLDNHYESHTEPSVLFDHIFEILKSFSNQAPKTTLTELASLHRSTNQTISKPIQDVLIDLLLHEDHAIKHFIEEIHPRRTSKTLDHFFTGEVKEYLYSGPELVDVNLKPEQHKNIHKLYIEKYCPSLRLRTLAKLFAFEAAGHSFNAIVEDTDTTIAEKVLAVKELLNQHHHGLVVEQNEYELGIFEYAVRKNNSDDLVIIRYNRDDRSAIQKQDFTIQWLIETQNIDIEVYDIQLPFSNNFQSINNISHTLNGEMITELFDTAINLSISNLTGLYSHLVVLGEKAYSTESLKTKNYYVSVFTVLKTMLVNSDNHIIKNLTINILKWLDKNITIENNFKNRKFIVDEIFPLLIKIRKVYRSDKDVFETVKLVINSLGNGSPNKAHASSIINKTLTEYKKKIYILNNIVTHDIDSKIEISLIKSNIEDLNEIEDELSSCPEISETELSDIINRINKINEKTDFFDIIHY